MFALKAIIVAMYAGHVPIAHFEPPRLFTSEKACYAFARKQAHRINKAVIAAGHKERIVYELDCKKIGSLI